MTFKPAPARQQGFVLIAVLGMIMLLALIAAFIAGYAEQRLNQTFELRERWQQQLDQQALLATLQHKLASGGREPGGWFWEDNGQRISLRADGRRYQTASGQIFSLQDEGALLSLMDPDTARWQQLLASRGFSLAEAEQLLDQLRDYTDQDTLRRLNGATASDYVQQGLQVPPQRFMISPGQVFNLLNAGRWRASLYELLPLLTTRSGQLQNLNTMPPALLATLPGVDAALAQELAAERNEEVFADLADANQRLGKLLPLNAMNIPAVPSAFVRVQLWPQQGCSHATWTGLSLTPTSIRAPWEIDYVFNYRHAQPCPAPVALAATALDQ